MYIEIEFDSEIPIYGQLQRQIIIGIANGQIERGSKLPSVRQLGEELGINLHTVNKTYNLLKEEGYLTVDRRVGAVVNEQFVIDKRQFNKKLSEELKFIIADSKNKGVNSDDFIRICTEYYNQYEGGNNNE